MMICVFTVHLVGLLVICSSWAQPSRTEAAIPAGETAPAVTVNLYFADPVRFALLAEPRQLARPETPVDLGRAIVRELTAGPENKHLERTLPAGDIIRTFFIAADKTAYIDLNRDMWPRYPGGVQTDMLAVYSIVNSLVLNMAEIDAVQILSHGRDKLPAQGHLDLHYPLKANILLIR
jgi:hypothetical protein